MPVTPKDLSPKVEGSLCNVTTLEVDKKSLPRPVTSNVLATVKRKAKKFDYQGFFEALFHVRLPAN